MTTALTVGTTPLVLLPRLRKRKSAVHRVALALVWITIALSGIVFSEPAPVDAMSIGLVLLLPVLGMTRQTPWLWGGLAAWLTVAAFGYIGAMQSLDTAEATTHISVSLYLYIACGLFAAFIAKSPETHTRLLLNAYLVAALVAASAAVIGYLDLLPGAYAMLTRYDRASGTFKDPNVLGPFLFAGLLIALHLWLTRPTHKGLPSLLAAMVITLAILLSFSRGAWAFAGVAMAIYSVLFFITAQRNRDRLKIAMLVVAGTAMTGLVVLAALQSPAVSSLIEQRASLTQPYDEGPEGRFGGQMKALNLILDHPLGIGGQAFTHYFHHEEAHNTYLTAGLNGGWIGGLTYFLICAITLALGWRHALVPTKTQRLFFIAYAALAANLMEGAIIDTDHWRHLYLLFGIVWGLMAADTRPVRKARIVSDKRPALLLPVLIVPPSRRDVRIVRRLVPCLPPVDERPRLARPRGRQRRPSRIV